MTSEELTREFNDLASGFSEFWALRSYKFFHQRIRKKLTIIISNYDRCCAEHGPRLFSKFSLFQGLSDPFISEVLSLGREQTRSQYQSLALAQSG